MRRFPNKTARDLFQRQWISRIVLHQSLIIQERLQLFPRVRMLTQEEQMNKAGWTADTFEKIDEIGQWMTTLGEKKNERLIAGEIIDVLCG